MPKPTAFRPAMERALAGRSARILDRCSSTNLEAAEWARDGAPHLSIVVADTQDAGRGRQGRSWIAEPGAGLLASIIVRPELEPSRWGLLPLLAGVAATEAIEARTRVRAGLKWPNDLVVEARKLGGILCEADPGAWAVIGIGINVSGAPSAESLATSLAAQGALRLDRADLAAALLEQLDGCLLEVDATLNRYRERSVTLGAQVRVQPIDGEPLVGVASAIEPDGALRLVVDGGSDRIVHAGDVEHLRLAPR